AHPERHLGTSSALKECAYSVALPGEQGIRAAAQASWSMLVVEMRERSEETSGSREPIAVGAGRAPAWWQGEDFIIVRGIRHRARRRDHRLAIRARHSVVHR